MSPRTHLPMPQAALENIRRGLACSACRSVTRALVDPIVGLAGFVLHAPDCPFLVDPERPIQIATAAQLHALTYSKVL